MTTFSLIKRTRIGIWYVLTRAQQGKLEQLASEARRVHVEILGLNEVRWTVCGEHKLASGQVLLYSGQQGENAKREQGVGFLLSRQAHLGPKEWKAVSLREDYLGQVQNQSERYHHGAVLCANGSCGAPNKGEVLQCAIQRH